MLPLGIKALQTVKIIIVMMTIECSIFVNDINSIFSMRKWTKKRLIKNVIN